MAKLFAEPVQSFLDMPVAVSEADWGDYVIAPDLSAVAIETARELLRSSLNAPECVVAIRKALPDLKRVFWFAGEMLYAGVATPVVGWCSSEIKPEYAAGVEELNWEVN